MKCPNCEETLLMTDKHGVEIDYCPNCRGVWLDRGELDKIIERAAGQYPQPGARDEGFRQYSYDDERNYKGKKPYHKKRKSFLDELFDFD